MCTGDSEVLVADGGVVDSHCVADGDPAPVDIGHGSRS